MIQHGRAEEEYHEGCDHCPRVIWWVKTVVPSEVLCTRGGGGGGGGEDR
jgi:hypothetical protein